MVRLDNMAANSKLPTTRIKFFDIVKSVTLRSGWIEITPEPKQSVRFGQGRGYSDPKKTKYCKSLREQIPEGSVICEPCELRVIYFFRGKENALKVGKSDWDNLTKPLQDALAERVVTNDNLICVAHVTKVQNVLGLEGIWWEIATPRFIGTAIADAADSLNKLLK